jgi:hypothetical protein
MTPADILLVWRAMAKKRTPHGVAVEPFTHAPAYEHLNAIQRMRGLRRNGVKRLVDGQFEQDPGNDPSRFDLIDPEPATTPGMPRDLLAVLAGYSDFHRYTPIIVPNDLRIDTERESMLLQPGSGHADQEDFNL